MPDDEDPRAARMLSELRASLLRTMTDAEPAAPRTTKRCPRCGSPDVVGYWARKPTVGARSLGDVIYDEIMRASYPMAERCMDCGHLMPLGAAPFDRP